MSLEGGTGPHVRQGPLPRAVEHVHGRMPHNGPMLMGNKKAQRITVGVIIGVMVVSLALSLISSASATP